MGEVEFCELMAILCLPETMIKLLSIGILRYSYMPLGLRWSHPITGWYSRLCVSGL